MSVHDQGSRVLGSPNLREGTPTDRREDSSNSPGCSNTQNIFQLKSSLHQVPPKYVNEDGPSVPPFPRRWFFGTGKQNRGRLFSRPRKLCPHTLVLTCDTSPHGIEVVLSHKTVDGQDQNIAYYCQLHGMLCRYR